MTAEGHPVAAVVDALRAQAKALDCLADLIEAEAAAGDRNPDDRPHLSGAFGADAAASYCGIGSTLLREQGPPARHVGGRTVWFREDLDTWLADLPVERTHQRGKRRSGSSRGGKTTGL